VKMGEKICHCCGKKTKPPQYTACKDCINHGGATTRKCSKYPVKHLEEKNDQLRTENEELKKRKYEWDKEEWLYGFKADWLDELVRVRRLNDEIDRLRGALEETKWRTNAATSYLENMTTGNISHHRAGAIRHTRESYSIASKALVPTGKGENK